MDPSSSSSLVPNKRKRDGDEPSQYCSKRPKHDVFLSYSSEDIGKSFVSHLKGALQRCGFDISDHTSLAVGQEETSELSKAIEESWIYVVVLSIQYPFSVKCLDELVLIMDSISKFRKRRSVFPIFYKVEPSHVRSQQDGCFLQAFLAHHDNHVDAEKVEKWKHALKDVGNLAGQPFQTGKNEEKFVHKIVKKLCEMKLPVELFDADHPVGIEPRAQDLISKLRLGDPDPSITAVLGMSGSGKTTLVKAVYDRIVPYFDTNCFIENVRYYKHNGPNWKVDLQREVISRFNRVDYGIYNYNVLASSNIKKTVSNRKVLLVLDDVDKYEQLQALGVHDPTFLAPGSRLLLTTTNKHPLNGLKKYTFYDMEMLNYWESSELFTGLAYEKGESADEKFVDEIMYHARGVPLVLEVWGQYFKSHDIKLWPKLLEKLRRIPHEDVQGKLQVRYDSLDGRAKKLFLYIACFFDKMKKDLVIKTLEDKDNAFFPDIEIQHLIDRYLVKEEEYHLTMHAVIREMGREVVCQENEDDPGERSRLVGKDVVRVLRDCSGTNSVRSIHLDRYEYDLDDDFVTVQVDQALRKMSNVRFIKLDDYVTVQVDQAETMSPLCFKQLIYLDWWNFPLKSLDKFDMGNVVVIQLWQSKLEILWDGFKSLKKLKILDVKCSYNLKRTGSFIGLENLEKLDLSGCENLEELDASIGCLQELVTLYLTECSSLKELDGSIGCLQKLVTLYLSGCYRLERIPWELIHKLSSLTTLHLNNYPNILNISHELWNLPDILSIKYKLQNMGELWNPPNIFNITHEPNNMVLAVPKEKHDNMGKGQGEVLGFPKFSFIYCRLKSHQQKILNVSWIQ